jgi:hypothetical protein
MNTSCRVLLLLTFALFVPGCISSKKQLLAADEQPLKIRAIQTRAFDTTDQDRTLRTVIATMQDLEFVIQRADADLGAVSGTKLDGYLMRLTVTVRPRGSTQLLVRANAQFGLKAVEDPKPYQNFFAALAKSMFLTAHEVE